MDSPKNRHPSLSRLSSMITVFTADTRESPRTPSVRSLPTDSTESTECCCCLGCCVRTQTTTVQHVDLMPQHGFIYSPPINHRRNSSQIMEWFDTLDEKCKMEAILAGHIQTTSPTAPTPLPINAMHTRRFSNVVVIERHTSESSPCCERLRRWTQCATPKKRPPPGLNTPSRYRSPSPEPTCGGLLGSKNPEEIYA